MKIFNKSLVLRKQQEQPIMVAVPDIKEYLVQEYERVNALKLQNENLEQELENVKEIKLKYEAALVTLNEYSNRLKYYETDIKIQKEKTKAAERETALKNDELNSYKIKLNNAALTKEQMKEDIIADIKEQIILNINNHKGNLSKRIVCEIIETTTL